MTRRDLLRLGVASALGGWLSGCGRCDAGFPPNMTMPVFYGYKDYVYVPPLTNAPLAKKATGVVSNPPVPMARVFYPSIAGTPAGAPILTNCEPFPLVLLIHGACNGVPYDQWLYFAGELARAGYVVAVTYDGGFLATGDARQDTLTLQSVHTYMRTDWEYRDTLMPSPNMALIGHSYGGTLAAELATQIPIKAFVSLSGTFGQVPFPTSPQAILSPLRGPCLFLWNNSFGDVAAGSVMYTPSEPLPGQMWSLIGAPKHGVSFIGGAHGDYMTSGTAADCQQGACNLVRPLSVDLTTTFLTKYLPPGGLTGIAGLVPDNLIVRPQGLPPPPNHGSYAGGFLSGLASSKQTSSQPDSTKQPCFEQVFWQTSSSQGSTYLVPS
jgi:pimeloyl-ACP methyl ester carboxylesterase